MPQRRGEQNILRCCVCQPVLALSSLTALLMHVWQFKMSSSQQACVNHREHPPSVHGSRDPVAQAAHKLCAWDGQDAAVGHALVSGMDVRAQDNYALRFAASEGHTHVVKLLCGLAHSVGVDAAARNNEALRLAACHGHVSVVELLCGLPLERGVDPGTDDQFALVMAAEHGHAGCVRVLCNLPLNRGVDAAARANRALRIAARNGHAEIVRILCGLPHERRVRQPHALSEALERAVRNGRTEVVAFFCNHVDVRAQWRRTALKLAVCHGHIAVVRILLESQPLKCWTFALRCAAQRGQVNAALFIADRLHSGTYDMLGPCLSSAVGLAAAHGHAALVHTLCDLPREFAVNAARSGVDKEHLWIAAARGHAEVVKALCSLPVDRGVNIAYQSRLGESVLDCAAQNGHIDVVRYLCSLPHDRGVALGSLNHAALCATCVDDVDVVRELYMTLCERDSQRPHIMPSLLFAAVHSNAQRCIRFLCTVASGLYAPELLSKSQGYRHTWTKMDALQVQAFIHQELLWKRARVLLSIVWLLHSGRASRRLSLE